MKVARLSTHEFARRFVSPRFPRLAEIIDYPMVGPILDRIDANPGAIFVVLGAPQIFKTFIGQIVALRSQMLCPAPALWYGKNEVTAEQVAEEKFNPLYDSVMPTCINAGKSEPAPSLLYADRNKRTKSAYTLPGGEIMRFLSAGVEINRQGKSAQDIYLDEPWEFGAGWIKEIQRRRGDFPRFRELHMMTGPTWGSYSHELWEQSTREVWHMRCPSCRKLIAPNVGDGTEPGGLRYESGPSVRDADGHRILSATRSTVEFECPHCAVRLPNSTHSRTALNAGGMYVGTNATPEYHIHGFRCPALPLRDWGEIVVEKITADRAKKRGDIELTEDLHRKTYADVWSEDVHLTEKKSRPAGEYNLGEEWAQEAKDPIGRPVRCCTVDVQLDHYVMVIRMWSKTGMSRLRWCEKVTTAGRIHDLCMEHGVIPERVYLDGRHDSQSVRRTAAAYGWRVLLGEKDKDYYHQGSGLRRIFSEPRMVDAFAGTDRRGAVAEFNFSKQSALSRLHLLRTLTEPITGTPLWTAARNAPEWYWKENEAHYRTKQHNPDGSAYFVWKGLRDDHAGDCEAEQIIFASMAGLIGAESLETEAEAPKQPEAA